MSPNIAALLYLVSGILFILALRGLSNPETARQGNYFGMAGMAIAILTSLLAVDLGFGTFGMILIFMVLGGGVGAYIARQIKMTAMPQLVAAFHSLVGMSAVLVAVAALYRPDAFGITGPDGHFHMSSLIELSLGAAIGAITFSGSVIAFAKLNGNMSGAPITFKGQHWVNLGIAIAIAVFIVFLTASAGDLKVAFWLLALLAFVLGVTLIIPIGGAVKQGSADDAAFILKNARKVIIVPGYGMAVAQAQHALKEMADTMKAEGVEVAYAIHPVAGRMPGHMNVLLAEANVPYDEVFELEDINSEFSNADVAFVIGANDVTNPAAEDDPSSPIYGMPVLQVWKAQTVFFIKRSLGSGYAGVENPLFFRDNTMMLLGDAKKMTEQIVKAMD